MANENEHVIVCGGQKPPSGLSGSAKPLALNLWGGEGEANVKFEFGDIHTALLQAIPARFVDLLEIAAYIYCVDQAIGRVKMDVDSFGSAWRRRFKIYVPVRQPEFWNSKEVKATLCETLNFLSDEFFEFVFHPAKSPPKFQDYLDFKESTGTIQQAEQVMMYSGGLDSLAGAIEEILVRKRRVVLVSHRSTPKLAGTHNRLRELLAVKAGALRPVHLNVRVSKKLSLDEDDHTQRTRSFLFGSLGATVATVLGLRHLRFYENGVLSMNLPMCAQLVGSRATRTTHPRVIRGFAKLFSLVGDAPFTVENPFIWDTKGEVIQKIVNPGYGPLIEPSTSCPHTRQSTTEQTHCGICSQCIDRRFGIIAAGAEGFDPESHYRMDLFTESRPVEEDKLLVAAYLERSNQIEKLKNIADFIEKYAEAARVFRYLDGTAAAVAERVFDLYKRHAGEVNGVVETMTTKHLRALRRRTLPCDCLLRLVYESGSVTSLPAVEASVSAPASAASTRPRFLVRKAGSNWEVIFEGGQPFNVADTLGMKYLDYLLHHPNKAIRAFDLEVAIKPEKADVRAENSVQKALSSQTKRETRKELLAAEADLEAAEAEGDVPKSERLKEEITKLKATVGDGSLLHADTGERARDNVRKAIGKVLQKLRKGGKAEKAFGQHVGQFVSLGYEIIYNQPEGRIWE